MPLTNALSYEEFLAIYPPIAGADGEEDNPDTTTDPGTEESGRQTSEGTDYESQYNELRSDYTRKTQSLSEYEQLFGALQSDDPELRNQAREILGLNESSTTDPNDETEVDPVEALTKRLDQLENARQSETQASQQEQQLEQEVEQLDSALGALEKKIGRELSPEEVQVYAALAVNNPNAEGQPDVEAAHQILQGLSDRTIENYRQSKQVNPVLAGRPDQKEVDFSDPDQRTRFMADYVRASQE